MYSKQVKSVRKSLRMSQDVEKYIASFDGDGFQEQFDSMIYFFKGQEEKQKERLSHLTYLIEREEHALKVRCDFLDNTFDIVDLCQEFTRASQMLRDQVKRILSDQSALPDMTPDTIPFGENTT